MSGKVGVEGEVGEARFSPEERAALDAWQAPEVPAAFTDGVLAAWREAPPVKAPAVARQQPLRGLAMAAVALLLLGGIISMRSLVAGGEGGPVGEPAPGFTAQDGGPGPEVRTPQLEGGSELQPS